MRPTFFSFEAQQKYDMVFSVGLIEHFTDTENIIAMHLPFFKRRWDTIDYPTQLYRG